MTVPRALRDLAPLAAIAALLAGVYLLPPDTSLAEVRKLGALDACVPSSYPPLVTGDPALPGLDVELLRAAASRIGVGLTETVVPAMGRDFNPRTWRITRAKCHVIAGGVIDTETTRSFLDVTLPHAETGWSMVLPDPNGSGDLAGARVGVLATGAGMDRLALSRLLRASAARVVVVQSPEDLAAGLSGRQFDVAITESLTAEQIASGNGWTARRLPVPAARYPVVFGLWKGDLTLKRALDAALTELQSDGTADAIRARYLGPRPGT